MSYTHSEYKNKTVLITGGAGFIGSNLALRLTEVGAHTVVLDSFASNCGSNPYNLMGASGKLKIVQIDLAEIEHDFVKPYDHIFDLAGSPGHGVSMDDPMTDLDANLRAHVHLLDACKNMNRNAVIVYSSTRQIYGIPLYLPVDESHPVRPVDVNGINNFAFEQYLLLYRKLYDLRTVSLRLTNTYGPRQVINHSRQGFMGWFLNRCLTGNPIHLYGGGNQQRDFTFVEDVVDALLLAGSTEQCHGKTFNVGGERASIEHVARLISGNINGVPIVSIPFPKEEKGIDIGDYYATGDSFHKITGWRSKTQLKNGMKVTAEFFKKNKNYYLDH